MIQYKNLEENKEKNLFHIIFILFGLELNQNNFENIKSLFNYIYQLDDIIYKLIMKYIQDQDNENLEKKLRFHLRWRKSFISKLKKQLLI